MSNAQADTIELESGSRIQVASAMDSGDEGHLSPTTHSHSNSVYETRYQKSLRHYLTREALPKESHYRNLNSIVDGGNVRPTLDDLHNNTFREQQQSTGADPEAQATNLRGKVIKFGWIEGVLMRCLLNIWGVMLFLRVSWMVGQAGLLYSLMIIIMANIVTVVTTLSMSAVATNGRIKGGGVYYMISRSLGPEFGGSIGLMFTLANSIAAATYIIGFCDSLQDLLKYYFNNAQIVDGAINDTRIVGTITLIAVLALAIVGMDWVTRVQMGLLFLLIGSQIDFVIGFFMGPLDNLERSQGFVGMSSGVFSHNFASDFRYFDGVHYEFFGVFGVFFPAVTGIVAGANLSGDLKDPGSAIPKGTLLAIGITFVTYIVYPFMLAGSVVRDASGNVTMFEAYVNSTELLENPVFTNESCTTDGGGGTCEFGLQNSFQVMELVSAWGPLIYAGCFAATLSSAIASLVGAPRVLQALAKDKLYPGIYSFSRGYGANNDPVRGYILVFVISFICIMIGDLNLVSTLLSNFFLAAYSLINFSCFHASLIKSPGWRPSFTYYNSWVSLVGGILCLIVMFLIDWKTALITFIVILTLYLFVAYRKPDVNWGSSTQAQTYVSALKSTLDLITVEEHVKNYRPQLLVLTGPPGTRPPLLDFAQSITKNISLLACGHVIQGPQTQRVRNSLTRRAYNWLTRHKIRAFYSIVEANNLEEGSRNLFQLVGLGKLRPNIVLLGYKSNWAKCDRLELRAYFNTLHEALDMYYGVAILRVPQGLDYSQIVEDEDTPVVMNGNETTGAAVAEEIKRNQSAGQLSQVFKRKKIRENEQDFWKVLKVCPVAGGENGTGSEASTPPGSPQAERAGTAAVTTEPSGVEALKRRASLANLYRGPGGVELGKDVLNNITTFRRKQKKGTIDVWWLYDDGGLTLLLPYILTTRSQWSNCTLRVFALANRKDELDMEQRSMANLLAKFRIDYSDVIVIPDVAKKAAESSRMEFDQLIEDFKAKSNVEIDKENEGLWISEAELLGQREKTNRHVRLRELLLENSREASLVVMTLPMPRKNSVSAPLYMAWLETLTRDMPPFLLIRGNQTSVLTFYS
ncbi:bumetanide-sensitive sodium-(potassium)-chloride cotransporter-like isoform X1 [Penaeus japonicus]|uniref:bumetanide-sensitive sodium-(potassium)-chloride cotransporter-like isoform X1 n=1 Tax=Penaeus japonicus TaxID=27405 RepID=UPI001C717585|nr:bumetanide-sensitive sodium-(potassium)-chloride cotransporter-like isoform X1 [Penaeus japonicus]